VKYQHIKQLNVNKLVSN